MHASLVFLVGFHGFDKALHAGGVLRFVEVARVGLVAVEAGAGLYRTKDTRRDPTVGDWDDEYIYRYRRWTLAPTKLEVSFSYIF